MTLRSMTGFGRASLDGAHYRFEVSVRTVNHRYLDCVLRLRDPMRSAEPWIRELIGERIERGHLELAADALALSPAGGRRVRIDQTLALSALEGLRRLAGDLGVGEDVRIEQLMAIPGVVTVETSAPEWSEEDDRDLRRAVLEALDALVGQRRSEGEQILLGLRGVLSSFEQLVDELETSREAMREGVLIRARGRLEELLQGHEVEPARLLQEAGHLAERVDVHEELERLRGHLEHFRATLEEPGPAGRRLDFLAQELYRESNTLAAKSRDVAWSRRAVDAKVLCEQLREQVQNVE